VAPLAEGSYVVTAYVADSGGSICGGRQVTFATLTITVSTVAPPVIDSFTVSPTTVAVGGIAQLSVTAHHPFGGPLTYAFSADAGTIQQADPSATTALWTAPQVAGTVNLRCQVSSSSGPPVTAQRSAQVVLGSFEGWLPLNGARATRVAGLPDGRLVVLDAVAGKASAVSTGGAHVWSATTLAQPIAAAATANEVFVLERGAKRIAVLSTDGSALRALPCPGESPAGLAAGPGTGELTVSDTSGAALYVISSSTGQPLRTLGRGTLAFPAGLACRQGKIAVADPALRRVVVFDGAGSVLATLGDDVLFVRPQGVAWDPVTDRLVVSDSFSAELSVMGSDGSVRGQLAGFGVGPGQITAPVDVQLVGGGLLAVPLATSGQVALFRLSCSLPPGAPPTASNNGPLCVGSTLDLSTPTVAGATYFWIGPNGFNSALQNPSIARVTAAATGAYSVTVTVGGCTSAAGTTTVTVNPLPATPVISSPATALAGQAGLAASVTANAGSTYAWSIWNGTITSGQGTSEISFSAGAPGTASLSVTETNSSGCTSAQGAATVTVASVAGATRFYTVAPCRVLDTRGPAGPLGGPSLQPGETRPFHVVTSSCGIPSTAKAISVNATVTGPVDVGYLSIYPGNDAQAPTASTINFSANQTRANNAILVLATDGSGTINVLAGTAGTVDFILDVNGFFQ